MVKAKSMTADDAKRYLIKQQEQTKQRQRQYVKDKKQKGQRRINIFISNEASKILAQAQEKTDLTIGEILSEALLAWPRFKKKHTGPKASAPLDTKKKQVVSSNYDKDEAETRISELNQQGMGPAEIARQLESEGINSSSGQRHWYRSTVSKILKRLKG